jgi:hypothetical protein
MLTYYGFVSLRKGSQRIKLCFWEFYRGSTIFPSCYCNEPITVAAQSKAWPVFNRSNTGIVGSYPTRGMDVCAFLCVCVVMYR